MTLQAPNPSFFAVGAHCDGSPEEVAAALERRLRPCAPGLVLFFADPKHDFAKIAEEVQQRFPDAVTAGCTTMGEIGPLGLTRGAVVGLALGSPCRAAAVCVPDLGKLRFEDGPRLLADLAAQLGHELGGISASRHVLLTLTDGLSGMEEILVASIGACLPTVPLVGGSAGDGTRFQQTLVAMNGRARQGAAVVLLLEPGVPFHAFQMHHYRPGSGRVVVTRAEPKRRIVSGLNGRPAATVLSELFGVPVEVLARGGAPEVQRYGIQLGFHVGDTYYMRSIMTLQGDDLLLGGAVEEGSILSVMHAGDIVEATREGVAEAQRVLQGEPAVMLAFNCGGRLLEAENRGVLSEFSRAICPFPCVGFTTYGEQFGSMQVNHTLTALLLGWPDGR